MASANWARWPVVLFQHYMTQLQTFIDRIGVVGSAKYLGPSSGTIAHDAVLFRHANRKTARIEVSSLVESNVRRLDAGWWMRLPCSLGYGVCPPWLENGSTKVISRSETVLIPGSGKCLCNCERRHVCISHDLPDCFDGKKAQSSKSWSSVPVILLHLRDVLVGLRQHEHRRRCGLCSYCSG
jgi:hypothetical protein